MDTRHEQAMEGLGKSVVLQSLLSKITHEKLIAQSSQGLRTSVSNPLTQHPEISELKGTLDSLKKRFSQDSPRLTDEIELLKVNLIVNRTYKGRNPATVLKAGEQASILSRIKEILDQITECLPYPNTRPVQQAWETLTAKKDVLGKLWKIMYPESIPDLLYVTGMPIPLNAEFEIEALELLQVTAELQAHCDRI